MCIGYGNHAYIPFESNTDALGKDCVLFSCDTIYWTVGFKPIMNAIYHGGTRIITSEPFTPALQLRMIEKYQVTILYNTPFIMAACVKSDSIHKFNVSSVKRIIFYGSKVPNPLIADIHQHFPNSDLYICYGLTEAGMVTTRTVDAQHHNANVNVGHLFPGCTVKIVDNCGNRCGPLVNGEICVKTEHQFLNYYDDPVATADAIDSEGFFRTGDIGHFDADANLIVQDRKKNVANVFYFENILVPLAIEEYLITLPGVVDICVVGIPLTCGECLPAAAVVRIPDSKLERNDVYNAVAGVIIHFIIDKFDRNKNKIGFYYIYLFGYLLTENFPNGLRLRGGVYFVEALPKTPSGKFIRRDITDTVKSMFDATKESDPLLQSYLSDIPDDYKRLI